MTVLLSSLLLLSIYAIFEIDIVNAGTFPSGMTWIGLGEDPSDDEGTVRQGYDDIYYNTGTYSTEIANNGTWLFYMMHIRELQDVGTRSYFMYFDNQSDTSGETLKKWSTAYTFEYVLSVQYDSGGGVWSSHFFYFNGLTWVDDTTAITDGYYVDTDPTTDDYVWAGVRLSDIGYLYEGTGDFCVVFTTESTFFPNQGNAKDHDPDSGAHCVEHEVIPEIPYPVLPFFVAGLIVFAYYTINKKEKLRNKR